MWHPPFCFPLALCFIVHFMHAVSHHCLPPPVFHNAFHTCCFTTPSVTPCVSQCISCMLFHTTVCHPLCFTVHFIPTVSHHCLPPPVFHSAFHACCFTPMSATHCVLHYPTSRPMLHVVFGSVVVLRKFIKDETEPIWAAWAAHVEYLPLMFSRSFQFPKDVLELDKKILEAQKKFDAVVEFTNLFKPKHHFVSHVVPNIIKMGPLPEYWCYSFEGFHQRIKRISRGSNWKNVCWRIVSYWCYQFGIVMGMDDASESNRLSGLA